MGKRKMPAARQRTRACSFEDARKENASGSTTASGRAGVVCLLLMGLMVMVTGEESVECILHLQFAKEKAKIRIQTENKTQRRAEHSRNLLLHDIVENQRDYRNWHINRISKQH